MNAMPKKFAIAAAVVVAAVVYLTFAGARKGWAYYLTVDQFSTETRYHGQRVKLCGTVAAEGFEVHRGLLTANFRIAGQNHAVPVIYHGAVPDMFRQGAEVVVEGKLNDSGAFVADNLLTKCASKYDAQGSQAPSTSAGRASTGQAPDSNLAPLPAGHPRLLRPS